LAGPVLSGRYHLRLKLDAALTFCLSTEGRLKAVKCRNYAIKLAEEMHQGLMDVMLPEVVAEFCNPDATNSASNSRIRIEIK
jgi:hypothetical protein